MNILRSKIRVDCSLPGIRNLVVGQVGEMSRRYSTASRSELVAVETRVATAPGSVPALSLVLATTRILIYRALIAVPGSLAFASSALNNLWHDD